VGGRGQPWPPTAHCLRHAVPGPPTAEATTVGVGADFIRDRGRGRPGGAGGGGDL